jgi:hypothetical protein
MRCVLGSPATLLCPLRPCIPRALQTNPVTAMLSTEGILTPLAGFHDSVCAPLWDNVTLPSYIVWGH